MRETTLITRLTDIDAKINWLATTTNQIDQFHSQCISRYNLQIQSLINIAIKNKLCTEPEFQAECERILNEIKTELAAQEAKKLLAAKEVNKNDTATNLTSATTIQVLEDATGTPIVGPQKETPKN